ncbi:MAG: RNA polymerase sigma factor [bacterium]
MAEYSDAQLIEEFQQGNESAFNRIVLKYQEKVYWLARKYVNDHDQADDITQEVFVKAYESFGGFRGESSIYTWLYRITINIALNSIRRQKVRDFFRIDELFDTEDVESDPPDWILEREEQRELITKAIATLPKQQKAVFLLRYYDELPYEEIAKILKTSVGGLKANYFHAIRKIQDFVKKANETH